MFCSSRVSRNNNKQFYIFIKINKSQEKNLMQIIKIDSELGAASVERQRFVADIGDGEWKHFLRNMLRLFLRCSRKLFCIKESSEEIKTCTT